MPESISALARRLAENAEAVCRHYLSNGRRHGRYWVVDDVRNTPGRSLYVRLHGPNSGKGAAGKWTDAATGEHGDPLDLIAAACGLHRLDEVALVATLTDTRLEPDLEDLLWSTVNLFHRAAERVERELDGNEQAQRRSQKEQDGSEVRSVELERLLAEGTTLIERRFTTVLRGDITLIGGGHETISTGEDCGLAFRPGPASRLLIGDASGEI